MSNRALIRVDFDYLTRRKALKSDNEGWKMYPVSLIGLLDNNEFSVELGLEVLGARDLDEEAILKGATAWRGGARAWRSAVG